jgi:hypothetical protein
VRFLRGRAVEMVGLDDVRLPRLSEARVLSCRKGESQERKEDKNVNLRMFRRVPAGKRGLIAVLAAAAGPQARAAVPGFSRTHAGTLTGATRPPGARPWPCQVSGPRRPSRHRS